jgi:hypothetical protein
LSASQIERLYESREVVRAQLTRSLSAGRRVGRKQATAAEQRDFDTLHTLEEHIAEPRTNATAQAISPTSRGALPPPRTATQWKSADLNRGNRTT